jgi:GT2 family glycosyltransferase
MERPKLLVCLPGNPDQSEWIANWSLLLIYLAGRFELELRWQTNTNVFMVRQLLAEEAERLDPDYVLWIDSDNVPTAEAFEGLYDAMEHEQVSILGAWYYYLTPDGVKIAAGRDDGSPVTEKDIEDAHRSPFVVRYVGLGFCLMRGAVFQSTGPYHFRPILDDDMPGGFMTDDVGFCHLARLHGYETYLHPGVRVEHLKVLKVPAPAERLATLAAG